MEERWPNLMKKEPAIKLPKLIYGTHAWPPAKSKTAPIGKETDERHSSFVDP